VHARYGHISTSGLKSDVHQRRFHRSGFYDKRENFGNSCTFKADIALLIFALIFMTLLPKMGVLGAQWGKVWCHMDPSELMFTTGGSYVCASFGENQSSNATVRFL